MAQVRYAVSHYVHCGFVNQRPRVTLRAPGMPTLRRRLL